MQPADRKPESKQVGVLEQSAGPSDFNRVRLLRCVAEREDGDSSTPAKEEEVSDACEEDALEQKTPQNAATEEGHVPNSPARATRGKFVAYVEVRMWQCVSLLSLSLSLSSSLWCYINEF